MPNCLGGNQELVCTSPILINPNWELEFHVHIDASQLAIKAIFSQKPIGKFDQPVMSLRFLNIVETNYTIT
jgi:hypothetical protein